MRIIKLQEATASTVKELPASAARWLAAEKIARVEPSTVPGQYDLFTDNVCGIVSSHGIQVEITPKLPVDRLVSLLIYARTGLSWSSSPTWQQIDNVADLLLIYFASELTQTFRFGLLRGYETVDRQSRFYRGRLRLKEQMSRHQMRVQPLEVRHQTFTPNIAENRILLTAVEKALSVLSHQTSSAAIEALRELRRHRVMLRDVTPLAPDEPLPRWTPNALNRRFHHVLDIAKLILSSRGIELRAGLQRTNGVVIQTWQVFEAAVARAFREALPEGSVSTQQVRRLSPDLNNNIRPDLVILNDGRPCAVADTKYKTGRQLSQNDLYQAVTYATVYGLNSATLIYAAAGADRDIRVSGSDLTIKIRFADTGLTLPEFRARVAAIARESVPAG